MKKWLYGFNVTILILLMTAAVLIFLAPRFGWKVDSVYSGSMDPALKVGGVVITRPVAVGNISEGDVITFASPVNNALTSHRVIALENSPTLGFHTKGDANRSPDPFVVPAENVAGVVCFHLPYLGYVASFMKTRLGFLLTICVPGALVIIQELINIWRVLRLNEAKRY